MTEKKALLFVVAGFTILCMMPTWFTRFPAMQDYPQHLLQAQMLSEQHNPNLDYHSYFTCHLRVAPYATFYAIAHALYQAFAVEIAGKLSISLYFLATTFLVLRLIYRSKPDFVPWGVVLFFPAIFNQHFYLGNMNFLYSLPVLILALVDHQAFAERPLSIWSIGRHALFLLALFMTHPFTFLVYIGLAGSKAFWNCRDPVAMRRDMVSPLISMLFFGVWYLIQASEGGASTAEISWLKPAQESLAFLLMFFTGLNGSEGTELFPTILWVGIAIITFLSLCQNREPAYRVGGCFALYLAISVLAVLAFPFRVGEYTFINLRMAAVAYFLLALVCGQIHYRGLMRYCLVLLVLGILVHSSAKQVRVSMEISEILPVVAQVPRNARILPLVFDTGSNELDRVYFDIHLHDHNYYHILVGGGFSPYFPRHTLTPVQYKPEALRPAPGEYEPGSFRWQMHAADYDYFLVRGGPPMFLDYLSKGSKEVFRSPNWTLYRNLIR